MKRIIFPILLALAGCAGFATHVFRTEQTVSGLAYTAYVGYTNSLANGTITVSANESNAIKTARIKLAASLLTLDGWRSAYETNSALKPQLQSALDAAVADSSNVVYLINLLKSK